MFRLQSMKLTWLIIDDTPMGTDAHICDFLCVQVLRPLCELLSNSRMKIGMALSPPLLQFLVEEEEKLLLEITEFVQDGFVELVVPLSFPSDALSKSSIRSHLEHRNRIYHRFFQSHSKIVLPFGFSYDNNLVSVASELGFTQIILNRMSMNASAGVVQHKCDSIRVLGVDPMLSHYSEQGRAKDFFIQLRNVAKSNHGSAVCCSFLHNLGLKFGSFERCWNKGVLKTIVEGLQKSQKWLKVVPPSIHARNKSVFPSVGYFPLNADHVSPWKRIFYEQPELAVLWNQLQLLEEQLEDPNKRYSLLELQDGTAFAPYPNGRLEDMHLRYRIWLGITQLMQSRFTSSREYVDQDGDGIDELIFCSSIGVGICNLSNGGMITMLLIPNVGNIANVITRRKRAWHDSLAEDPRLPSIEETVYRSGLLPQSDYFYKKLGYDKHRRGLFGDVLYCIDTSLSQIRKGQARIVCNLTDIEFKVLGIEEDEHGLYFDIEAQAQVGTQSLTIQKSYIFSFENKSITVNYIVENNSLEPVSFLWGMELNIGLQGKLRPEMIFRMHPNPFSCSLVQAGHRASCTMLEWVLLEGTVRASLSQSAQAFFYPIEVPMTEPSHIDMSFQGHCGMFGLPVELWADEKKEWTLTCLWEG